MAQNILTKVTRTLDALENVVTSRKILPSVNGTGLFQRAMYSGTYGMLGNYVKFLNDCTIVRHPYSGRIGVLVEDMFIGETNYALPNIMASQSTRQDDLIRILLLEAWNQEGASERSNVGMCTANVETGEVYHQYLGFLTSDERKLKVHSLNNGTLPFFNITSNKDESLVNRLLFTSTNGDPEYFVIR